MNFKVGDWVDFKKRNSLYLRRIKDISENNFSIDLLYTKLNKIITKCEDSKKFYELNEYTKLTKIEKILLGLDDE